MGMVYYVCRLRYSTFWSSSMSLRVLHFWVLFTPYLPWVCITLRYFKLELFPKKAIQKADLPPFLTTWLDRSSPDCMFSTVQLKTWPTPHLQACPWYIECHFGVTPPEERALFLSLKDVAVVEPEFDKFAGMDPEARAKAARKREAADRKKVEKWNDAEKKA